jgi:hypothetical protein
VIRFLILAAGLSLAAHSALAQSQDTAQRASASLTIERSLSVATVRPMSFNPVSSRTGGVVMTPSGPAVIRITGDPGRVYRVTLPTRVVAGPGDLTVDTLTVISDNSGDITRNLTARMDSAGFDRLQITGLLSQQTGIAVTNVSAAVPIGVDYE